MKLRGLNGREGVVNVVMMEIVWTFGWWFLMMFLPQLPFLLLCWNFDDSRLVNDPCCSLTLLHNPNDPGLVSLLLLNVLQHKQKQNNNYIDLSLTNYFELLDIFRNQELAVLNSSLDTGLWLITIYTYRRRNRKR